MVISTPAALRPGRVVDSCLKDVVMITASFDETLSSLLPLGRSLEHFVAMLGSHFAYGFAHALDYGVVVGCACALSRAAALAPARFALPGCLALARPGCLAISPHTPGGPLGPPGC